MRKIGPVLFLTLAKVGLLCSRDLGYLGIGRSGVPKGGMSKAFWPELNEASAPTWMGSVTSALCVVPGL